MNSLFLFDIDGTLVDIFKLHIKAYFKMFEALFGDIPNKSVLTNAFGKPTSSVIQDGAHSLAISEEKITRYLERAIGTYHVNVSNLIGRITESSLLPGVRNLLNRLETDERNILGIISGNDERIGKKILRKTKLEKFFVIYAFGNQASSRTQLIRLAFKKAKHLDLELQKSRTWVIGDTPHDIQAAIEFGAHPVGVSTGFYNEKQLRNHVPGNLEVLILDNLSSFDSYLKKTKM